jgi:hypothetical protein
MQGFYTLIGFSFVAGGCLLARTNSTAILGTVVDPSGDILRNDELDATPKKLRQNQCGSMFSGPGRFCTRLIEFSKGVV